MKTEINYSKIQDQISKYFDLDSKYFSFTVDQDCGIVWLVIYGTLLAGTLTSKGVKNDFYKI